MAKVSGPMAARSAGQVLNGGKRPRIVKARAGGWTQAKRAAFLGELAATCNVSAALRKVKMGKASVYKLRRRSAEFRSAWSEAIREAYAELEIVLLDRAINGTVKTVVRVDGRRETIREYPNGIALALMKLHSEKAEAANREHDPLHIEEVRERIMRKLAVVRKRLESGEEQDPAE